MIFILSAILPCLICLFWTAIYVLDWKISYPAKRFLGIFMGVSTMLYMCHAVFFCSDSIWLRAANSLYTFCTLAVFPLYYIYIKRLTHTDGLKAKNLIVLLPAIVLGVCSTCTNIFAPDNHRLSTIITYATRLVFVIQLPPICYLGYKELRAFDDKVANLYSNLDFRSMKNTRHMMVLLVTCAVISVMANYIGRDYFAVHQSMLIIPSTIFSVLLFSIGYTGMRQGFSIDGLNAELRESERLPMAPSFTSTMDVESRAAGNLSITNEVDEDTRRLEMLQELMTNRQLFLNHDLRLTDLSKQIGVNRSLLSSIINTRLGLSFSDYVNSMRIEYAKELMRNQNTSQSLSQASIAEMSGFSNEASFYRVFKKHIGMTPRQWSEKLHGSGAKTTK